MFSDFSNRGILVGLVQSATLGQKYNRFFVATFLLQLSAPIERFSVSRVLDFHRIGLKANSVIELHLPSVCLCVCGSHQKPTIYGGCGDLLNMLKKGFLILACDEKHFEEKMCVHYFSCTKKKTNK